MIIIITRDIPIPWINPLPILTCIRRILGDYKNSSIEYIIRMNSSRMSRSKTPTSCKVGNKEIAPCCDRKEDRSCHFRPDIDYERMREEHQAYKQLERKLPKQKKNISESMRDDEIELLKKVKLMRETWLKKYYRPECRKCDNKGINHDGYLNYLQKHVDKMTRRKPKPKGNNQTRRNSYHTRRDNIKYNFRGGSRKRRLRRRRASGNKKRP